jgi:hypothetical protein
MTPMTTTYLNLPVIMAGTSQSTLPAETAAASRNLKAYQAMSDQHTTMLAQNPVEDSHIRFPRDENGTTVPPPAYTLQ